MVKKILNILFIVGKLILIVYILCEFWNRITEGATFSLNFDLLKGSLIAYYFPLSVLSLFILFVTKYWKVLILTLIVDISILSFGENIIKLFI